MFYATVSLWYVSSGSVSNMVTRRVGAVMGLSRLFGVGFICLGLRGGTSNGGYTLRSICQGVNVLNIAVNDSMTSI